MIGTVSSEDKARLARANGCELPLVGRDYRFAAAVKGATGGRGADVIYDGLGRAAMEENLEALALCGHWVSYGQASGPLPPIGPETLSAKSATVTRPVLFHYTAERAALDEIARQTFDAFRDWRDPPGHPPPLSARRRRRGPPRPGGTPHHRASGAAAVDPHPPRWAVAIQTFLVVSSNRASGSAKIPPPARIG